MIGYRGALRYTHEPEVFAPQARRDLACGTRATQPPRDAPVRAHRARAGAVPSRSWATAGCSTGPGFELWIMAEVPSVLFNLGALRGSSASPASRSGRTTSRSSCSAPTATPSCSRRRSTSATRRSRTTCGSSSRARARLGLQTSICGQAPSVHPEYAELLVRAGIDAISVSIDAVDAQRAGSSRPPSSACCSTPLCGHEAEAAPEALPFGAGRRAYASGLGDARGDSPAQSGRREPYRRVRAGPRDGAQRVLEAARELTGARYAALGVLDERPPGARALHDHRHRPGDAAGRSATCHAATACSGVLIRDPKPLRLARRRRPPALVRVSARPPADEVVPRRARSSSAERPGATCTSPTRRAARQFDEADEEAVVVLADWAGVAIDNARAYSSEQARRAELEQAVRALEATTAIARAVGGETDLDRVLELVVKRARALVDARRHADPAGGRRGARGHRGRRASSLGTSRERGVPLQGSVSGSVMRRAARACGWPASPSGCASRWRIASRRRPGSWCRCSSAAGALGVLAAFDRGRREEFTAEDEHLLESFAASAATAVATAQNVAAQGLRRSIEASERERQRWARELHDETLQSLAGLKVMLSAARRQQDRRGVDRVLATARSTRSATRSQLRRLITDLRPAALDEFGTAAALEGSSSASGRTSGLNIALNDGPRLRAGRAESRRPRPSSRTRVPDRAGSAHERRQARTRDPCHRDGHGGRAWRDPARRHRRRGRHPGDRERQRPVSDTTHSGSWACASAWSSSTGRSASNRASGAGRSCAPTSRRRPIRRAGRRRLSRSSVIVGRRERRHHRHPDRPGRRSCGRPRRSAVRARARGRDGGHRRGRRSRRDAAQGARDPPGRARARPQPRR